MGLFVGAYNFAIAQVEITSLLNAFSAFEFQYDSAIAFCTCAKSEKLCLSLDWTKLNYPESLLLEKTLDLHGIQVLFLPVCHSSQ